MSTSTDIINSLKQSIIAKQNEIKAIDNLLLLYDAQLDKYDALIKNIDKSALPLIDEVNAAIDEVKAAYDERITSGCRNSLSWQLEDTWSTFLIDYPEDEATYNKYTVLTNPDTASSIPYVGIKYYRNPSDRDYGANIIVEFVGDVSTGSTFITVTSEGGIPDKIQIGDTITDDVDSPEIYPLTDLPKVVGFGTTGIVGIVTTLVGGISTGSTIFAHYGSGTSSNISLGSVLERSGIVTATITGIGSTEFPIVYYDPVGVFTTGIVTCTGLFLSISAVDYAADVEFNITEIQEKPTIGVTTIPVVSSNDVNFTVIREDAVAEKTDFTKSPNSPLTIGIVKSSSTGTGNSSFYDESGNPDIVATWNQNESYYDPIDERVVNPEPIVGAGKVIFNIGNFSWPTLVSCTKNPGIPTTYTCTSSYADEGTSVTIGSTSSTTSLGSTSTSPLSPSPSLCTQLDNNITEKLNNYNSIRSANVPKIQSLVSATRILRKQRTERQLYAWSLLQAKGSLQNDIIDITSDISELENIDFSGYEN